MPSDRLLTDTVTLFNYIGEEDYKAKYGVTVLHNVSCRATTNSKDSKSGTISGDSVAMYIFLDHVVAKDRQGNVKEYLPFSEWQKSSRKESFWTIRNDEKDCFFKGVCDSLTPIGMSETFSVSNAVFFNIGSRRNWHWKINGV